MTEYLPLVLLTAMVVALASALPVISSLLGLRRPSERKLLPYECGIIPDQEAQGPVSIKFGLIAILFLLFDVELIFFYPWAASYGRLGLTGLLIMLPFLAVLVVGFLYEWRRGSFEWEL